MRSGLRNWVNHAADHPRSLVKAIIATWVVCSLSFALIEGKGPIEGLWWGIVTASTTGYGDYSPESTPGRFVGGVLMVSMWFLTVLAGVAFTKNALFDPDAWTDAEQQELLRTVRESSIMLKHLIEKEQLVTEYEATYEPPSEFFKAARKAKRKPGTAPRQVSDGNTTDYTPSVAAVDSSPSDSGSCGGGE